MSVATVTVVFTDLADSTEQAERLGPSAAEQARRSHFEAMRRVVAAHDGTEVKTTGDGLMLVFQSADRRAGHAHRDRPR
jgi:class 3 adenylate cyclase